METEVAGRKKLTRTGWRISEAIRRGVNAGAALTGVTAERYAAEVLAEHLAGRGLLPRDKGREGRTR